MGYRTIEQTYEFLLAHDKNCCITKYCLRMLCKKGVIQVININQKYLIHLGSLLDYLKLDYKEIENENK